MKAKNGISKGEKKVKGGKLIKCEIEVEGRKIKEIKFTGDFFIHPEEMLEELEENLREKNIEEAEEIINSFFENIEGIGVTADDFIEVLKKAVIS